MDAKTRSEMEVARDEDIESVVHKIRMIDIQTRKDGFASGAQWGIEHERAKSAKLVEAIRGILSTVSIDWYVAQFAKDTTPNGRSSGVVGKIYNRELERRIASAFEFARTELKAYESEGE